MLQSLLSRAALIFFSTSLLLLAAACSRDKQTKQANVRIDSSKPELTAPSAALPSSVEASPAASLEPQAPLPSVKEPNSFELGLDKASGALSISLSAQSVDDWLLVANQYQDAIAFMQNVQPQSPYFFPAQTKIAEYKRLIKYAQEKTKPRPATPTVEREKVVVIVPEQEIAPKFTSTPTVTPIPLPVKVKVKLPPAKLPDEVPVIPQKEIVELQSEVFAVPIKRRIGGTPIIEVTFNGGRQFEMIVDTGASGTVITKNMANALGVVTVGKAKANTASSKSVEFPIGYVESIAVAGVTVNKVAVAIAGDELETGLLGHDFFGDYELTIKRDVVEFRPPSPEGSEIKTYP
ncbi:MAG: retroviral-like aspartic protease family protein [Cyanomargarita calcarea GSE-NOS-MK-12-04C]|jgi:predicted aspartyl protease|uniref:Retroviral-like aspartic protease family protein n=1 Tax=Cyanomargarita calcarea GSE-NOS-MK-12-04C TaxID=2839659 RepID=A0A951QMN7_9CYAN|nr:retroviral-like aspartic protease family protein [Cyanomargarita calcarea GSE-NOS-MK-12-04C]